MYNFQDYRGFMELTLLETFILLHLRQNSHDLCNGESSVLSMGLRIVYPHFDD